MPRPPAKKHAKALLDAAEMVLLESLTRATGFEDSQDFKRSLISALDDSPHFHAAVKDLHRIHNVVSDVLEAKSRRPETRASGRVQASRLELGRKKG